MIIVDYKIQEINSFEYNISYPIYHMLKNDISENRVMCIFPPGSLKWDDI